MVTNNEEEEDSGSVDASSREHPGQSVTCGKKKMGRPRKLALDDRTLGRIEGMAALGATVEEIAIALNVDKKTFLKFMDDQPQARQARRYGRAVCAISLRRKQFRLANTSARMAIHLGEIYLWSRRPQKAPAAEGEPRVVITIIDPMHKPKDSPQ
jgi:hypothetical protein